MNSSREFQPSWFSSPGDTVKFLLTQKELSMDSFLNLSCLQGEVAKNIIDGIQPITEEYAKCLARSLGGTTQFWLNRETQFVEDLEKNTLIKPVSSNNWPSRFPVSEMVTRGWIDEDHYEKDCDTAFLEHFKVDSFAGLHRKLCLQTQTALFRTSKTFDSAPESVFAWLNQGTRMSSERIRKPWNPSGFCDVLKSVRSLSFEREPRVFIPMLQEYFAKVGVAFAVLKNPDGCKASGATFFLDENQPMILLSMRYHSNDHFWFSLYHEAGHLILHRSRVLYFDEDCGSSAEKEEEEEANEFASNMLIPEAYHHEVFSLRKPTLMKICRLAKKIGIAAGVIVGQLQHRRILKNNELNSAKVFYDDQSVP